MKIRTVTHYITIGLNSGTLKVVRDAADILGIGNQFNRNMHVTLLALDLDPCDVITVEKSLPYLQSLLENSKLWFTGCCRFGNNLEHVALTVGGLKHVHQRFQQFLCSWGIRCESRDKFIAHLKINNNPYNGPDEKIMEVDTKIVEPLMFFEFQPSKIDFYTKGAPSRDYVTRFGNVRDRITIVTVPLISCLYCDDFENEQQETDTMTRLCAIYLGYQWYCIKYTDRNLGIISTKLKIVNERLYELTHKK